MLQTRPPRKCLVCDFCPSVRDFASGFLQIPPRDGHPCLWLTVPTAKSVADFHRQVIAHAGLTTNEGLHAAWNTGLCVATGEYLCFVDSDDYVENNMVEVMLSYANTDDADVHVFGYWHDYINTSIKVSLPELIMSEDVKKNIFFQNIEGERLVVYDNALQFLHRLSSFITRRAVWTPPARSKSSVCWPG